MVSSSSITFGIGQPSSELLPINELWKNFDLSLKQNPNSSWQLLQYGNKAGSRRFRKALANFLNYNHFLGSDLQVNEEELFVTAGASSALHLICSLFLDKGNCIFIEEPTYFLALNIFRDFKVQIVGVPVDNQGIIVDSNLETLLQKYNPKFIYTVPTFNNPTTSTLSIERRKKLIDLSQKYGFYIVADEVYQLLRYTTLYFQRNYVPPPSFFAFDSTSNPKVISVNSFSKILGPGIRLGWIQANPSILNSFIQSGLLSSGGSLNHFSSGVVTSILESGFQQRHLEYLQRELDRRSKYLYFRLKNELPKGIVDFEPTYGGYFLWLTFSSFVNMETLKEKMEKAKVRVKHGPLFSVHGNKFHNSMRLSFAYYDTKGLEDGLNRFLSVFSKEN